MTKINYVLVLLCSTLITFCGKRIFSQEETAHLDHAFIQDYSVKYNLELPGTQPLRVFSDRNGKIEILTNVGLHHLYDGRFLYPGKIVEDQSYRFMKDKKLIDMILCDQQFVFMDDQYIFSNAWAGSLHVKHQISEPILFQGNDNLNFLVSDGKNIHFIQDGDVTWRGNLQDETIIQIISESEDPVSFLLLTSSSVYRFSAESKQIERIYQGQELTAFDLDRLGNKLVIGSNRGYFLYDLKESRQIGGLYEKLPWTEITAVKTIGDNLWFGTIKGAFMVEENGHINYYASERWLPNDHVLQITQGSNDGVLLLTKGGIAEINFKRMSLHEKAVFYEKQVRTRHIRNGFNASLVGMEKGNLSTGYMGDSDNDGLWTSLYLASQAFRYATTTEEEALQNCIESLDAMERLYTINPVSGFPARSFERSGHIEELSDPERWQQSPDPEWVWKATTSSDEAIGHIFAFGVVAEIVKHKPTQERAIALIDLLMNHIVKNDLYLIDFDGKPTLWGKWNPEYVNSFSKNIGDRKLNSSNIISMLQTAYHFTKKEVYKEKAFELMDKYGYLENLTLPMAEIGKASNEADELSKKLSTYWNHSDDEMYFAGYWGLYKYAFNDTLKTKYKEAIIDHWESERPEKDGAWNVVASITGIKDFDLEETIWFLKEYPMDLIQWTVNNSHRKDIEFLKPNFRNQTIKKVLPPDELKISRHNANRFVLDGGSDGKAESSAGDIWLFPYWMGRYLKVIK